jgi:hypothetical protein
MTALRVVAALALAAVSSGHAFLSYPNARGAMTGCGGGYNYNPIAPECRTNYCCQCGNAAFLQNRFKGKTTWRLYSPMDRTMDIRGGFGLCGDGEDSMTSPNMKLGYFSNGCEGKPALSGLNPGDTIDIQMQSTAHHQGFIEMFLCDTKDCGGDITRDCFYKNQCVALQREPVEACESGNSADCAPIDPKFPTRWYMPCHKYEFEWQGTSQMVEDQTLGGPSGAMRYRIPNDFNCGSNCVLQSYWATANTCAPAGHNDYFRQQYNTGKLNSWKGCPGDGETLGGYSENHETCGAPGTFPEEFWQCADIHMNGARFNKHDYSPYYANGNNGQKPFSSSSSAPAPAPAPAPALNAVANNGNGNVQVNTSGGGGCVACLSAGRWDCYMCKHPVDYQGQYWFINGETREENKEYQFRICLAPGGNNQEMCWWCYDDTKGKDHRCIQS